jgi:polyisoprenyl-phosphate glycosyltransferase
VADPTYSFVIPIHDEEETLPELHRRLAALLDTLDGKSEVILVDDGSRDTSYPIMLGLNHSDPRIKVVRLSRNFGHQLAISAGVDFAEGDAVILMDGDLQHPPEVVPEFIAKWREGYEVVYGVMRKRTEGWLKRTTARIYYGVLTRLSDVDLPAAAGDFRLLDRSAVEAFKAMRERNRYVRGMLSWVGFSQVGIPYDCPPRFAGHSKYSFGRMLRLGTTGITSFSDRPLRIALRLGYILAALSIAFGISAIAAKLAGVAIPGWTSIAVITSFIGAFQLVLIGILGEYVARVYDEVKARPLYLVQALHGFEADRLPVGLGESAMQ